MRIGLEELEGEVISGRYQILRRIGKGGMGVVYLAQQTNLGRNVCIKVLNPALLDDEDAVGRFEREAKGLSRLQHPNIVTIFDYGRDGDLAYIVMEYAQGVTLSKYLKAHGALTLDEFLPVAVQILKGIGEAHKLGLIHRDIKPANIILAELEGESNFVKILDFGLAKLAQGQEDLTKEQQLVGSASYMAPEQILTGASDPRTDVYALGVMFYLMLAGRKPFNGSNDNVILYKHVNEIPSPLKTMVEERQGIPETLCEVVDQCLMKEPEKRPQTALDLLKAISYALDAPQLRAGFSSMSLARIDLQKVSEEAETHFIGTAGTGSISAPVPSGSAAPAESAGTPGGIPMANLSPASSVSSVVSPAEAVASYPTGGTREERDRKMLIILIVVGAALVAIVVSVAMGMLGNHEQSPKIGQSMQEAPAVGSAQGESAKALPETADGAQPENNAEAVIVKTGKIQLKYDAEHQDALTVYVNGEKQSQFSDILTLDPGKYDLKVTRQGYQAWESSVDVAEDKTVELEIVLKKHEPESQPEPERSQQEKPAGDGLIKDSGSNDGLLDSGSRKKKKSKSKSKGSGLLL